MGKLAFSLLVLIGCSKSKSPLGIQGEDNSGKYIATYVKCYNSSGTLTATSWINGYLDTLTIAGNVMVTEDNGSSCIATTRSTVVFNANTHIIDITGNLTSTNTGSSCTFTMHVPIGSGGTITPNSFSSTLSHGGVLPDVHGYYVKDFSNGDIGILVQLQVQGSPSDDCYLIYEKQ